jgi:hypothetical protein
MIHLMEHRSSHAARHAFGHPAGSARSVERGCEAETIVSVVGAGAEHVVSMLLGRIDARLMLHPDWSRVSLVVVCDSDEAAINRARRSSPDAAVLAVTPTDPDGPESAQLYAAGAAVVCGPEHPELILAHVRAILRRARWASADDRHSR